MFKHNMRPYWPFCRVKTTEFTVTNDGQITFVKLEPDYRHLPICHGCKQKVRSVRDLPMALSMMVLHLRYRKVRCPRCGIRVEHHTFVDPCVRPTHCFANYIFNLCQHMTVEDVAKPARPAGGHEPLSMVHLLKAYLKRLWQHKHPKWAQKFLNYWCQPALESGIDQLRKFVNTLQNYSYGIINHCNYAIHTGKLAALSISMIIIPTACNSAIPSLLFCLPY